MTNGPKRYAYAGFSVFPLNTLPNVMFIVVLVFVVICCVDQKRLNVMYIMVLVIFSFEQDIFLKIFE